MRRSLTITPENERRIQGLRSTTLGLETPVDLDYTTATNMLVELGFLTLEQMGTLPEGSMVPLVPLPFEDVVRVLFRHVAQSSMDMVQDREQLFEEFIKKDVGIKVFRGLRNLSGFQPKKHVETVEHMTVKPHSSSAKGTEQVPRKA